MFDEMVSLIQKGRVPQSDLLRKRLDRALIKKLAVIKTPSSFWSADRKINPSSKELLWAAILLDDKDSRSLVEGIIATEMAERAKSSGREFDRQSIQKAMEGYLGDLLRLSPSEQFRKFLQEKIDTTLP